jgi:tRNA dimethylallyltransferase
MQVYRFLDIGTAKPGPDVVSKLPHHLIDIVDPDTQFSAGEFVKRAEEAIAGIAARGGVPVMSGGTAFYMKTFAFGLPATPPSSRESRERVRADARARGLAALYEELSRFDPEYAATIGARDASRVTRALEVFYATGRPLSSFAVPGEPRRDYRCLFVGLERDRADLHARIERRVEGMLAAGLAGEVEALRDRGYGPSDPGMKAIGYREFFERAAGSGSVADLIKRNTRRYAKRQVVFFRSLPGVRWLHADDLDSLCATIAEFMRGD